MPQVVVYVMHNVPQEAQAAVGDLAKFATGGFTVLVADVA